MSFTDKNQKSDEAFNVDRQSQSSGSRRVMWKLSDDEETFDSIVNYRRVPNRSTGAIPKTSATTENHPVETANTSTQSEEKKSTSSGADAWTHIFNLIKCNKLAQEITTPNLALRYKPSKESLKHKHSKEEQDDAKENVSLDNKFVITDIKLETCCLPPQQSAVVQEAAPKFAQRIPTNETDSSETDITNRTCSAGATILTMPATARNERDAKLEMLNSKKIPPSPESSFEAIMTAVNGAPTSSPKICKSRKQNSGTGVGVANNVASNNGARKIGNNTMNNSQNISGIGAVAGTNMTSTFRQRQLELHRYRIQVEQRRLDLLDLKIAREREESLRSQILFQKELEFKSSQLKQIHDDFSSI